MFHMYLKRMYIWLLWSINALNISNKPIWSRVSFKVTISLLIFFLEDLSIDVNSVLKSPTVTVLLLISPCISTKICFIYLGAPMLGTYYILLLYYSLHHYVALSFLSYYCIYFFNRNLLFKLYLCYLFFRERGMEGKEGENHQYVRAISTGCLLYIPSWGPGLQPRHGPDSELNQRHFGSQEDAQPTETHQPA